ncbi:HET-domain-containing protein [Cenococcum geophilum]
MRLLERNNAGELSLTKDFVGDDIPRYAILSHTWGADTEEVTFEDLMDGTGAGKPGYNKIQFCGEQARRDGLQYFWVDTCCIDKSNSTELSEAINSMFRWYRNAAKCYVYLSDVSRHAFDANDKSNQLPWESAFRKSRWFTRGWTLQELIAPASVEFFSKEGEQLDNKNPLERHVYEITGIPVKALQGSPLSDFSVTERMLWAEKRETTRKEDKAYSLLGIFDVHMPLIYGEGREKALRRLREEIDKASKGFKHEDFSIAFSLSDVSEIEHFVAREEELAEMHRTLSGNGGRRTVVLHGLGGIGKTQLTVAYAKRHKDNYSAILWLNIKDEDALKQSFAKVAGQILREHPSASRLSSMDMKENLDEVIDAVKLWLSLPNNTRWLIIYDNYDNPKLPANTDPAALDIRKFLPKSYQGSVIITTRSSQVRIGHTIQIRKLENVRDSLEILSNTSRREGLINDPDAVRLAKELDGLPLALATAGAYLDQVAISLSDYLRLYKASWMKLQKTSPELSSLLHLWAYFNNQDLWLELLQHGDSEDPEWIRELTQDELSFHSAARVLSNHGLVEVDTSSQEWVESRGYSIHGCVHSWIIHVLNQEWDYNLARLVLKFVGSHVPGQEAVKWWLTERRLLQHAARCSYIILNGLVVDEGMAWACHNLGSLYAHQGKLDEAEKMYMRALQGKEEAHGPKHTSTLKTVNNLGILYADQGKVGEAEEMYMWALQGEEEALGPKHTSTLQTVGNLGILYADQGKVGEAEKMYMRALQGYEEALGPKHISTLQTVNNLGILYADQGKVGEAEKICMRALQGKEEVLGPKHTSTLQTVNNLGILYKNQGKLGKAEKMYMRALQGYEEALGPKHILTLKTVGNLGILYADQGKLGEAEKIYMRALQGYEEALGPKHISTLQTNVTRYRPALNIILNLGYLFAAQGGLTEAKAIYLRALASFQALLGPSSNNCRRLEHALASLNPQQGIPAGAEVPKIALGNNAKTNPDL